jgi:hypothetical protein
MAVTFRPSQILNVREVVPPAYTTSPITLLVADIILCLSSLRYMPGIIFPIRPFGSGQRDELYPSADNLRCVAIHGFLIVYQLAFILTLPICILLIPPIGSLIYVFTVLAINTAVCKTLNGKQRFLVSKVKRPDLDADDDGGGDDYDNNDDGDDQKKKGVKRRSRGSKRVELEKEHWMFVNGVAVGSVLFPIIFILIGYSMDE